MWTMVVMKISLMIPIDQVRMTINLKQGQKGGEVWVDSRGEGEQLVAGWGRQSHCPAIQTLSSHLRHNHRRQTWSLLQPHRTQPLSPRWHADNRSHIWSRWYWWWRWLWFQMSKKVAIIILGRMKQACTWPKCQPDPWLQEGHLWHLFSPLKIFRFDFIRDSGCSSYPCVTKTRK